MSNITRDGPSGSCNDGGTLHEAIESVIPLQFGTSTHTLFGLYHPPEGKPAKGGVILCNPWGQDYLRGHGALRHLALRLQQSGYHVLRFDYFGCGDSGGNSRDASLECWCDDTSVAIEELEGMAGVSLVSLVGARYGAVIASRLATERADIERVVLWDPVIDSREHLEHLAKRSRSGGVAALFGDFLSDKVAVDIDGCSIAMQMVRDILNSRIDGAKWRSVRSALLITDCQQRNLDASAITTSGSVTLDFTRLERVGQDIWDSDGNYGSAGIPVEAIDAIVKWLN